MTRIKEERIDEKRPVFTTPHPPYWNTDEGTDKANEYVSMSREELAMGDRSDFELANAQYLVSRDSISLLSFQTAAKERIRWLSAQLARADLELKELRAQGGVRVAPLEWHDVLSPREDGPAEPSGDYEASNGLGSFYYIRCYFGSDSYGWEVSFDANAVSDHDNPEDAKASAFEHHTRSVLSALETEAVEPVSDLVQRWQEENSNFHKDVIVEVVEEFETWRRGSAHPPHSSIPTVTGEMVERGARAIALHHYSVRFDKPVDDPHVVMNADANWNTFLHEATQAIRAALSSESKP